MVAEILSCRGCVKSYGRKVVLAGVDLDVLAGDVMGLVGPNGAGKTTLLHAIVGVVRLDRGAILVGGMDAHRPEAKQRVAFMPDDLPRPVHLTGRELVMLTARLYGRRLSHAQVDRLATSLDLTDRLDEPLSAYSHGMARKTDLLAALAVDPDLLVLDEPFSGLDPAMVDTLDLLVRERRTCGKATLLSSHDLELVGGLADRIVMLSAGMKVFDGPVSALVAGGESIRAAFRAIDRRSTS